jgi:hypothetical protein
MGGRLVALAIALIVAAAPVALTACELMCAAHGAAASQAPAHACYDTEPDTDGAPAIAAPPHGCGHVAVLPSAAKSTGTSAEALRPATDIVGLLRTVTTDGGQVAHPPPPRSALFALLTPLRI